MSFLTKKPKLFRFSRSNYWISCFGISFCVLLRTRTKILNSNFLENVWSTSQNDSTTFSICSHGTEVNRVWQTISVLLVKFRLTEIILDGLWICYRRIYRTHSNIVSGRLLRLRVDILLLWHEDRSHSPNHYYLVLINH